MRYERPIITDYGSIAAHTFTHWDPTCILSDVGVVVSDAGLECPNLVGFPGSP
jgi:hypothetical protein